MNILFNYEVNVDHFNSFPQHFLLNLNFVVFLFRFMLIQLKEIIWEAELGDSQFLQVLIT